MRKNSNFIRGTKVKKNFKVKLIKILKKIVLGIEMVLLLF